MTSNPVTTRQARVYQSLEPADAEVERLLEHLGAAVTSGDGDAVAELWALPAMVLGARDVRSVSTREEIASFFGNAREEYNAQGIVHTRAEVRNLTWITRELALVEVRWPYLTAERVEKGSESATYVLRRDESGVLKIQVAILHGGVAA